MVNKDVYINTVNDTEWPKLCWSAVEKLLTHLIRGGSAFRPRQWFFHRLDTTSVFRVPQIGMEGRKALKDHKRVEIYFAYIPTVEIGETRKLEPKDPCKWNNYYCYYCLFVFVFGYCLFTFFLLQYIMVNKDYQSH